MVRRKWLTIICPAVMLFFLPAGCASTQSGKKQMAELQAQVTELQAALVDMNLRMEEMNSSLFVLRESTRANREAIKKMQEVADSPTVYIEQPQPVIPPATLEYPGGSMPESATGNPPAVPPAMGEAPRSFADDQAAFNAANAQMDQKNWGLAIYDFNAFVTQYPKSAYLPRARYCLGESYRQLTEYAQAIRQYEMCLQAGQAAGPYAPRALFWIAQCNRQLGRIDNAQQAQERLLLEYPESPEAKKITMNMPR